MTDAKASAKKTEEKQRDFSAAGLWNSERKQLVSEGVNYDKYSKAASEEQIAKVKKALEAKHHKCTVVSTAEEAVKVLGDLIPQNVSIGFGYSTTHNEIGFTDYIKTRTDLNNYRVKALELDAKKDHAGAAEQRRLSQSADVFVCSVSAVTEEGEMLTGDASGSRLGGISCAAKNVIIIVGSNKIVKNMDGAWDRLYKYCLPIESRRAHYVFGVEKSAVNNTCVVNAGNPWNSGRIHVVLLKGAYGF
jgi:L-lactate utilization protein LutC